MPDNVRGAILVTSIAYFCSSLYRIARGDTAGMMGIVGFVVGIAVSTLFYYLSTRDLREKTKRIVDRVDMVLRGLEVAGLIQAQRNEAGGIDGFVVNLKGTVQATSHMTGTPTVTKNPTKET